MKNFSVYKTLPTFITAITNITMKNFSNIKMKIFNLKM